MTRVFVLFFFCLALQGCISFPSSHGYMLERGETELTALLGVDTKESVLAKYGEPSLIGTFDPNAWYYLSSIEATRAFFRPDTRARSVISFHFDDKGVVQEIKNLGIEDGDQIKLVSRTTPTRGKELSFWEQLLGNVGQLPGGLGQQQQVPGRQGGPGR